MELEGGGVVAAVRGLGKKTDCCLSTAPEAASSPLETGPLSLSALAPLSARGSLLPPPRGLEIVHLGVPQCLNLAPRPVRPRGGPLHQRQRAPSQRPALSSTFPPLAAPRPGAPGPLTTMTTRKQRRRGGPPRRLCRRSRGRRRPGTSRGVSRRRGPRGRWRRRQTPRRPWEGARRLREPTPGPPPSRRRGSRGQRCMGGGGRESLSAEGGRPRPRSKERGRWEVGEVLFFLTNKKTLLEKEEKKQRREGKKEKNPVSLNPTPSQRSSSSE